MPLRAPVAISLAVTLLAACAGAGSPKPPPTARFSSRQVTFEYPAPWFKRSDPDFQFSFTTLVTFLSSQPLADPCTRVPPDRSQPPRSITCGLPLKHLAPGGVLVGWYIGGFPGWTLELASGTKTEVGGLAARIRVARPGSCVEGSDETITATMARQSRNNYYLMLACLRGPGVASEEKQVRAMLASTRFPAG